MTLALLQTYPELMDLHEVGAIAWLPRPADIPPERWRMRIVTACRYRFGNRSVRTSYAPDGTSSMLLVVRIA